jgi:hypothetical protein
VSRASNTYVIQEEGSGVVQAVFTVKWEAQEWLAKQGTYKLEVFRFPDNPYLSDRRPTYRWTPEEFLAS